ncbi:MAG: ribosome assembly RNA-binding protein YhbY [Xanthomonadales bacterium]|jgi:RNA-binding protein
MPLNNRQLRFLRGLTHKLKPVVIVADKGLTENVLAEIETALEHHELIKVKLRADRAQRAQWAEEIRTGSGAEVVHSIGQVVAFYRRNPDKPVIELPV